MPQEARLGPRPKLSLEEWAQLPEDEAGELVEGRLEEEEMPGFVHEFLVALLCQLLMNWILPRGGLVGGSDARFAIREDRGRKPDVTVYLPGSAKPPRHGLIRQPPDIAIEIVSPTPRDSLRDRVDKVTDYAAFGVRWYWIVDPQLRSLEILELGADGRYIHALGTSSGIVDVVPGCEGLMIDLDSLWNQVDRLAAESEGGEEEEAAR